MRRLFLINPRAGRGDGLRRWQEVRRLLGRKLTAEAVIPAGAAATRQVALEAARAGVERLIVLGGDGTLSGVAGALAGSRTVLGVVPAGTGNDFCRNLAIPSRLEDALRIALWAAPRRVDLGAVDGGGFFLNAAGLGFDGAVAAAAARYPRGFGGTLPYLLGALSTLTWFRPVQAEVTVDRARYSGPAVLVVVANGAAYGGGMQIAPGARPDDGLLDVFIAGPLKRSQILRMLRMVYTGRHIDHPGIRLLRGRRAEISLADGPVCAHLDGEPARLSSLRLTAAPGALNLAAPALPADIPEIQSFSHTADSILWHEP